MTRNVFDKEDSTEVNLGDVVDKPLASDIINQMAADTEERKDVALALVQVNPMQANLISRMLKTLKVEHFAIPIEGVFDGPAE